MNGGAGRVLADALVDAVAEADPVGTARVMDQLAGLSGPGWLRLDELARRPYWGQSPFDAVADWLPLPAAGGDLAGVAASMCRDGRIREAAVRLLAGRRAPAAAAALAVRVADWVPEVSSAAWAAVSVRTAPQDAAAIIPVFLALGQRRRGRRAAAGYLQGIADGPAATLAALAAEEDRACRLWALQAQADRGLLSAEVLAAWAMRDRDPVVALWCARSLAGPAGLLPAQAGLRLLGSARAGVRAFAAGHLPDDQLTRHALQVFCSIGRARSGQLPGGGGGGSGETRGRYTGRCWRARAWPGRSPQRCRASMKTMPIACPGRPFRSWPITARVCGALPRRQSGATPALTASSST